MESATTSPLDPVVMALQIQVLTANLQELMKKNEELKCCTRLEGSITSLHRHSRSRHDEEVSSPEASKGKDASEYTRQSTHGNDQMMKSLRRELDKVKMP